MKINTTFSTYIKVNPGHGCKDTARSTISKFISHNVDRIHTNSQSGMYKYSTIQVLKAQAACHARRRFPSKFVQALSSSHVLNNSSEIHVSTQPTYNKLKKFLRNSPGKFLPAVRRNSSEIHFSVQTIYDMLEEIPCTSCQHSQDISIHVYIFH